VHETFARALTSRISGCSQNKNRVLSCTPTIVAKGYFGGSTAAHGLDDFLFFIFL
jgi:hypothetical protein